jgi:Flp pilus assembly protein TadD
MTQKIGHLSCLFFGTLALAACAQLRPSADPTPHFEFPDESPKIEQSEIEPLSFEQELAQADQLRDSGQLPEAVWRYLRVLRLDPASPIPRQRIAYLHLDRDVARGEEIFRQLVEEHPAMPEARVGLGLAEFAAGKYAEARASLDFALKLDPQSAVALTALGVMDDGLGSHELAREHYERAGRLAPMRYEIPNNVGMSFLMSEKFEEAVKAFRSAIFINPKDPVVHNNLGFALGRMGEYELALESFDRFGAEADALNNTGYTCSLNGDYSLAIQYYEHALRKEPTDRNRVLLNLRAAEDALLAQ